jgi:uncharacterized membrane protein HdeD (DUF308 family)
MYFTRPARADRAEVFCAEVSQAVTFSKAQNGLVRRLARRRLYLFFFGLYLVTAASFNEPTAIKEIASFVAFAAILAGVLVILVGWRRRTLKEVDQQLKIILGVVLIVAATVVVNFHFPSLVFTFLLLLNWFV